MNFENYSMDEVIFATKSAIEHVIWDMVNSDQDAFESNNTFFNNLKSALQFLNIECSSIKDLDGSNVLKHIDEIYIIEKKFDEKYPDIKIFTDCDILGELK